MNKNSSPKVSILMGSYNPRNRKQLTAAIHSIMAQSFIDWELLLYDDGSDEFSAGILRQVSKMDQRIHYLRGHCNQGLAHALNQCIHRARGTYLARMDDDDLSLPTRLQIQVHFLDTHPQYQWVGCAAWLFDNHTIFGKQLMPKTPQSRDFLSNSPYIHPTVMFRREVLVRSGGYSSSPVIAQCEDYELFMRLHAQGYRGYNLPDLLFCYRENHDAYCKRTYSRRIREAKVRFKGFRQLGILHPRTAIYVIKPLLVGLLPTPLYGFFKKQLHKNRTPKQERGNQNGT